MFVKLTLAGSSQPIWMRALHIVNIIPDWQRWDHVGDDMHTTHVLTTAGEFDVSETPDEIMRLIRYADIER